MEWTFDPLEIRNANFNIESLGVICRRYDVDTYGMTSSPLHGNLPTDRLLAEWHLSSSTRDGANFEKFHFSRSDSNEAVRLELPLNIQELKTDRPCFGRKHPNETASPFLGTLRQRLFALQVSKWMSPEILPLTSLNRLMKRVSSHDSFQPMGYSD